MRNQGNEIREAIAISDHDDDRNACLFKVLLVSQVLVGGEKDGELCVLHFLEQLTVFGSCPAHFGNGFDFVLGELSF